MKKTVFFSTKEFVLPRDQDKIKLIYSWYARAMKKRGRESLEEERFIHHFFRGGSLKNLYV